ncbi:MAG: hypothetical protein PUD52_06290, partial [Prevotella sp.]|nr:hypothetical protein [Prevotella sp.]
MKPAFDANDSGVRYDANSEEAGIVARAKADGTYMKAPNGQPSKLTPRQWVQVRTKAFKEWFGDWEKAARVEMIQGLSAIGINPHSLSKDELHDLYRTFKPVQKDGHSIAFYNGAFKKIYKEGGLFAKIVPQLRDVFEQSLFAYDEADSLGGTVRKDGTVHKEHKNIVHYQNYVGKVDILGNTYYVRFTVQEEQSGLMGTHSFFVSNVDVYDNPTENRTIPITSRGTTDFDGIADAKLKKFFEEAKNSSRVVDENGEPRVVYHGSRSKRIRKFNSENCMTWVSSMKGYADAAFGNGGKTYSLYAKVHRPLYIGNVGIDLDVQRFCENTGLPYEDVSQITEELGAQKVYELTNSKKFRDMAVEQGYDGLEAIEAGGKAYAVFEPSQIKSATDNVGTFDGSNPDIRYQFVGERGAAAMDKAEEASVRLDNLAVAREMEASGKDAKAVKLATGWERGADGKWRYEIGDGKLKEGWKEKAIRVEGASLSDVLDNEELFNAYPQLRSISVSVESLDEGTYGEYRNNTQMIALSDKLVFGVDGVLSHEVQHAIQYIEGFAKGGSPLSVRKSIKGIINEYKDASEYAKGRLRKWAEARVNELFLEESYDTLISSDNPAIRRHAIEKYWDAMNFIDNADGSSLINDYPDMSPDEIALSGYHVKEAAEELKRLASSYMDEIPNGNMDAMELVEKLEGFLQDKTDKELYKSLGGEVEARNVSKRLGMPAEERRRSLASETEDVAREDQIFLEEGVGVSQMGSRVDGRMAEIGRIYAGRELDGNAQTVVDVFSGKSNNETITAERDGKAHKVVIRQGTENKAGTKHSLLRHYGTGVGTVTADDLLLIPEVVERGEMEEKGRRRVYRLLK